MSRKDGHGLKCPKCGSARLFVSDTRSLPDYVRRRRKCEACNHIATSYEVIERLDDPAGTRIGDVLQLREHLMKLKPGARVAVRMLLTRLAEPEPTGRVEPPAEQTLPAEQPDDIPS